MNRTGARREGGDAGGECIREAGRAELFGPMSEFDDSTRVWLITGCSSGLGKALARGALEQGHRVIATARDTAAVEELASGFPETCRTLPLDVTDTEQVKDVVAEAARAFGRLDVVVNNAGYGLIGALEELEPEQIERNFAVNFFGAVAVIQAALPVLRAQQSGHFVNISAAAAISNYAGFSIYGATKCALEGMSEALAQEVKPLGIKVTLIEPGPFRTEFIGRSMEKARQRLSEYDRSSGKFMQFLDATDGKQSGDPVKAAEAIIQAVMAERPPMRLVMGKYAVDKVRKKLATAEKELKEWEELSLTTDHRE